ncbi:hypothetical protein FIBSPDRAFT_871067 [Athelia psychrophila]|uniref:Uncharacterized protein n=1 Tax=Athelia psychrophila TaxID=1759441 RepID=A0A166AJH1_9AGAM|nr:hypothetical protein FIBSPDRAFT_871067 [Fibularhizoctonia sp. CBS 109695]
MYQLCFVLRQVDCSKGYSGTSADEFHNSIVPQGIPEHLLTPIPYVNESVSASGNAKTSDYGRLPNLDTFPTVFRIKKVAGQDVTINPFKASAEATAETSEIAGQSAPKYLGVPATVNLIAVEGEEGDAFAGLAIDSTISINDTSLDLQLLGTGTGPAMDVGTKHIRSGPVMPNGPGWWGDAWDKVNKALTPGPEDKEATASAERFFKENWFGKIFSNKYLLEGFKNAADISDRSYFR